LPGFFFRNRVPSWNNHVRFRYGVAAAPGAGAAWEAPWGGRLCRGGGAMLHPCQMSGPELDRLIEAASELTGMRAVLPVELFIKLDTFRADLMAEREDRGALRD
jgi:hypothetical protein